MKSSKNAPIIYQPMQKEYLFHKELGNRPPVISVFQVLLVVDYAF